MPRLVSSCICVLVALVVGVPTVRSEWRIAGQTGGSTSAITTQGNYAFIGLGSHLHIYDISNPSVPVELGATAALGDFISDVAILDSRAYVTAGTEGLFVFDISNPAGPREIGRWNSPGSAEGVAVSGTTAYVADGPFGLHSVDVTNPASLVVVASAFDGKFAFDVAVRGPHVFVAAAGTGLLIADVTVPSKPRELATLDTPGYARAIAVSGTTLYLADEWGGMRIIDVADPLRPLEVGAIPLQSWAFAATVSGTTLYVAAGAEGMHVYDVSDSSRPQKLGLYDMPWQLTWKIAVAGSHVLLGMRTLGVHVLDVLEPGRPQLTSRISPLVGVQAVSVHDNLAFLMTESQGMRIADISNPAQPRPRGGGSEDWGWTVLASGNRVYACEGRNPSPMIRVFDVSNPDQPRLTASVRVARGYCRDMALNGTILYVADEFGLVTYDVANPDAPAHLGLSTFPTDGAIGVDVSGTTAFVVSGNSGLQVVDAADPRNLRIIGSWSQALTGFNDVLYHDGRAYLASGFPFPQLLVLDVRDPTRPLLLGSAALPETGRRVRVRGATAYIAAGTSGVAVLDVLNPAAPVLTTTVKVPGFARDVAFAGDRLLAVSTEGVFVFQDASTTPSGQPAGPAAVISAIVVHEKKPNVPPSKPRQSLGPAGRSIVVTNAADSGDGTLRDAMNSLAAGDNITFDPVVFPSTTPAAIRVQSVLPSIQRDGVTIDGSNAGVILDGGLLTGQFESGITISAAGVTIRGLQILNFPSAGVEVGGNGGNVVEKNVVSRNLISGIAIHNPNGNRVIGNRIGTDPAGRVGLGRQSFGLQIFSGDVTGSDRIGGDQPGEANVIAGNVSAEVFLHRARGQIISGNLLGTDPTGTSRVGEARNAIATSFAAGNLITGNVMASEQEGVWIVDTGSCCNRIAENWIGLTKNNVPFPTGPYRHGVTISEPFNLLDNNRINFRVNISALDSAVTDTVVIGNKIAAGSRDDRGGEATIWVYTSSRTFIGGPTDKERNEITGKLLPLQLGGATVDRTFISGNSITGNSGGIDIGSASLSFVRDNIIASNQSAGISVSAATNRIRRNSIHDNVSVGISMAAGANGLPPPPVVMTADTMSITGTACAQCSVDIYSDSGAQGRWQEGTTEADLNGRFFLARNGVIQGPNITATATDRSGSTSAFSNPLPAQLFVPPRGGLSSVTSGAASSITVGYGRLHTQGGAPLSGMAIFGYRTNNVLVSEAAVPASVAIRSGRIYAEIAGAVNTGIAIANPNDYPVNVDFYFTDSSGQNFGAGAISMNAGTQIARFLDQAPFSGPPLIGSFTFTASAPVAAVALRGLTNERSEFLITTLPVADLSATTSAAPVLFPHFAAGGGWSTQIVMVNPSDSELRVSVQFSSLVVVDGQMGSSFPVMIPPRSSRRLVTGGEAASVQTGYVRLMPESSSKAPSAVEIFSYRAAGVTVSEAGVPAVAAATAFRVFAESSPSIRTGFAIFNPAESPVTVNFELTMLDGTPLGPTGSITVPANGQVARFINEMDGFQALTSAFQGILRATTTSSSGMSIIGLRGRYNERGDFLITTTQPVAENSFPGAPELFFPHFADGAGYTTQFVVFNPSDSPATSGQFRFLSQSGQPLTLTLR